MAEDYLQDPVSQTAGESSVSRENATEPLTQLNETNETADETNLIQPPVQHTAVPSLEFPTREFLNINYKKPELQKRCLELGITNIWTSKSQLIDMILDKSQPLTNNVQSDASQSSPPDTQPSLPIDAASGDAEHKEDVNIHDVLRKVERITAMLETKDMEIELLNTEMKTAYHTIQQLQQRVQDLEKRSGERCTHHITPAPHNSCLLLGDTNLRAIFNSDLDNSCTVKTIEGANMDLLRSWITDKLNKIPSTCIIYNGIYDILEGKSPATILDDLGCLISDLKEKNNNIKVHVCQVVPLVTSQENQAKTDDYNEHLIKWGETNGINIIKCVSSFKLYTGELDDLCFNKKNDSISVLNRLGVIKLLNTMKRQCPELQLRADWEKLKKSINTQEERKQYTGDGSVEISSRKPIDDDGRYAFSVPAQGTAAYSHYRTPQNGRPYTSNAATQGAAHRPPIIWDSLNHRPSATRGAPSYRSHTVRRAPAQSPYTTSRTASGAPAHPPSTTAGDQNHRAYRAREATAHSANTTPDPQAYYHTTPAPAAPANHGWGERVAASNTYAAAVRGVPREMSHTDPRGYGDGYGAHHSYVGSIYRMKRKKVGCYNCGEFNHVQVNCRFDHKVLCGNCQHLGHKSRLCHHYST